MKRIFIVLMMLTIASLFMACEPQPAANNANKPANANAGAATSGSSEADVRKALADLQATLGKNDTAALDKIYADDYTFVTAEGEIQTKAQRLESMRSGELKMESITFDDAKIRMYGDAAVVNAKTTVKSTMKGKDSSGTATATIVFAKTKDGWRVVLGHPSAPTAAAPAKADDKMKPANTKPDAADQAPPAANKY